MHKALKSPTVRPTWVYGPFPSPFELATITDDAICIASGIGITPAICVVHKFGKTRRINLIWIVREPTLIEFFLDTVVFDNHAWTIILYTGKRELVLTKELPEKILIFTGRPNLENIIIKLIGTSNIL